MGDRRIGRNDPCPCGSGKKFKYCCLHRVSRLEPRTPGRVPGPVAAVTATDSASPHPLNQRCKVFQPETRQWMDAPFRDVRPGQEFVADGRLYKMWRRDVTAAIVDLDVRKIPDADRPYDPAACRIPKGDDVVLVLGDRYPDCGHWRLSHLRPGQRCLFQGRVYAIEDNGDPTTCKLVGTDLILGKGPPRLPEDEEAVIENVMVRETRVTCAPMPAGQGLEGTLTPPTPAQVLARYRRIQGGDPIAPTEVIVQYTHPEPFGHAEVELLVAADQCLELAEGTTVDVLDVRPGMGIRLTDGAVGKVTGRRVCFDLPEPPRPVENGLWESRVTAKVRHTAMQILPWRLGGRLIEGTPGHLVWSVTRRAWVRACELRPGEFVRTGGSLVAPVEGVGPLRVGRVEVYGLEVEYFHNYFVGGLGEDAMLVHNGLDCVNKPRTYESVDKPGGGAASGAEAGGSGTPESGSAAGEEAIPQSGQTAPDAGRLVSPDGTPINPIGKGRAINVYGEGEAAGFNDFATEAKYANGRPLTSTLPDGAASDLALRDAPLSATTQAELQRLAQPGARITYANADVEGFQTYADQLEKTFPNARVVEQGTVTGADGIERGVVVLELP